MKGRESAAGATEDAKRGSADAQPLIPWWAGGLVIRLKVLTVATGLVQPIGVSTQYVVFDGAILHAILPDLAAQSPYLSSSTPGWTLATYEFFFVLGIPLGGVASAGVTKRFSTRSVPPDLGRNDSAAPRTRLWWSFVGGVPPVVWGGVRRLHHPVT
ncbi:MAG: hypothetical protein U0361_19865 [Nitrospiraceae bacterium]